MAGRGGAVTITLYTCLFVLDKEKGPLSTPVECDQPLGQGDSSCLFGGFFREPTGRLMVFSCHQDPRSRGWRSSVQGFGLEVQLFV